MKHIKSAITYHCELPDASALEKHFEESSFSELGTMEFCRAGFVQNPEDTRYATKLFDNAGIAFTLRYDEKVIPTSVTNAEVKKAVARVEEDEDRRLTKKERQEIREHVYDMLLGQAFTKTQQITCFYVPASNLLIVPTGSKKTADIVTGRLLKALGSIKAKTIYCSEAKQGLTTKVESYLNGGEPFNSFEVGGTCKLKAEGGKATAFKLADIVDGKQGILEAIAAGAKVVELGLSDGSVELRIDDKFILRGVYFISDALEEETEEDPLLEFKRTASIQVALFAGVHADLLTLFEYKPDDVEVEVEDLC